jgi:hypothetical protein
MSRIGEHGGLALVGNPLAKVADLDANAVVLGGDTDRGGLSDDEYFEALSKRLSALCQTGAVDRCR